MTEPLPASQSDDPRRSSTSSVPSADRPELGVRVVGERRRGLGTLDALAYTDAGKLATLTVRHGLYSQRLTTVVAEHLDAVERDAVVLRISKAAFMHLPWVTEARG